MDILILNTRIYKKSYIMDAINAYSEIIEIEVEFNLEKNKGQLRFKCSYDKDDLFKNEFCNYLIALIAKDI